MHDDRLTHQDHDRDSAGMTYVYPVVSRRAGGVSIGVNLNPNNACNWACVYCQVPGLRRGSAPAIDLERLERELRAMLHEVIAGDFMVTRVPEGLRRLNDIAFSGNGEPTSATAFAQAVERVTHVIDELHLTGQLKLVLITNGSLIDRPRVQAGLRTMAANRGEVWFKFDRATAQGMYAVNQTRTKPSTQLERLRLSARLCPTWVQSCFFAIDGQAPAEAECAAYLAALRGLVVDSVLLQGVLLYGLARPSMQPQAARLSPLPADWLEAFGERIRALGIEVRVTP